MYSHVARSRLVYPAAVLLTLGLVSVPHNPGSATTGPRLTEFAAVQLQAEVTALVTGIPDAAEATPPGAAASILTGSGAGAAATGCTYPCTIFDKFLESLPEDIRYALLPAVYSIAWVIGLVMAPVVLVTSALFGWPYSLGPAASTTAGTTPETNPDSSPAPAEVTAAVGDRAVTPVDDAADGDVAVEISTASENPESGVRMHRDIRGETVPLVGSEVPQITIAVAEVADTAGSELPAAEVPAATEVQAGSEVQAATEVPDVPADAADVPVEAMTATDEPAPVSPRPAGDRIGSAQADNSDSAPKRTRAATRSTR